MGLLQGVILSSQDALKHVGHTVAALHGQNTERTVSERTTGRQERTCGAITKQRLGKAVCWSSTDFLETDGDLLELQCAYCQCDSFFCLKCTRRRRRCTSDHGYILIDLSANEHRFSIKQIEESSSLN